MRPAPGPPACRRTPEGVACAACGHAGRQYTARVTRLRGRKRATHMQIMITQGTLARTRVLQFNRMQLMGALTGLVAILVLLSGTVYHFVFLKAAREGWPVVSHLVRPIVSVELAQRERYMRDSVDAMAQKVGQMQARMVKLESMGERVSKLVGVDPGGLRPAAAAACCPSPGRGFAAAQAPHLDFRQPQRPPAQAVPACGRAHQCARDRSSRR
jgi:hypothetical protein